jgi:hypothetical protein
VRAEQQLPQRAAGVDVADRGRHEQQAEVQGNAGDECGNRTGAGDDALDCDDLRAAGENDAAHDADLKPGQACLSCEQPERQAVDDDSRGQRRDFNGPAPEFVSGALLLFHHPYRAR